VLVTNANGSNDKALYMPPKDFSNGSPATGLVRPVIILAGRPAEMDTALLKRHPDVQPTMNKNLRNCEIVIKIVALRTLNIQI
jgi:hypothetical protein